jgi:hypothetical protein
MRSMLAGQVAVPFRCTKPLSQFCVTITVWTALDQSCASCTSQTKRSQGMLDSTIVIGCE